MVGVGGAILMRNRLLQKDFRIALGIVTRKGGDLRKQGSVSEASIARPGVPGNALFQLYHKIFPF